MATIDINRILDLSAAVTNALQKAAVKTETQMTPTDVPKVAPPVIAAVRQAIDTQVQPVVDNQTNAEPWYKSRVVRGSIVVIATTAWAAFTDFTDGTTPDINTIVGYAGPILGAAYAIYGRITNSAAPAL